MRKPNYLQYIKSSGENSSKRPISDDERCFDYIEWHYEIYKKPADRESINAVMREFQGLDDEAVEKLIGKLVYREVIKVVESGGSVGWVICDIS